MYLSALGFLPPLPARRGSSALRSHLELLSYSTNTQQRRGAAIHHCPPFCPPFIAPTPLLDPPVVWLLFRDCSVDHSPPHRPVCD